jgi:hypothetical protein
MQKHLARDMRIEVLAGGDWVAVEYTKLARTIAKGVTTYLISSVYAHDGAVRPGDQSALEHAATTGLPIRARYLCAEVVVAEFSAHVAVDGPCIDYRTADGSTLAAIVAYTLTLRHECRESYDRAGWQEAVLTNDPPQYSA